MPVVKGKFRVMTCEPYGDAYQCVCQCGFQTTARHPNAAHGCADLIDYGDGERPSAQPEPQVPPKGPGTELKKLLATIGITASPDCKCNQRARHMDEMEEKEPGWCAANIDEIVGWLREAATDRGLPFVDMAGRMLVKRAIKNAKRNA